MAGADTLTITDGNFDSEVLESDVPVLVDFWADWCMPCRALGPTIDELAAHYKGRVKVGKLDTDQNQGTAVKFSIQSIPTIILFQDGEIKQRWLGVTPKKEFQSAIDGLLQ
jgi:thioredoxin 1